jgi:DNA-binding NtrC family response regulator
MVEKRILIAEDDRATRESWSELLSSWGYKVEVTEDGQQALEAALRRRPQIILADLKMARKDGLTLLRETREAGIDVAVVMISGEGDIPNAVSAIKLGAYEYLRKPIDPAHLKALLSNIMDHLSVREENDRLRRRLLGEGELGPMLGRSLAMRRVLTLIDQVAPTDASAIITGESGTGKEIAAKTIHALSKRSQGPYIAVNCVAIPETLMESELFGHERGAFTGADRRRDGYFEWADGGMLLLDEISEMKVLSAFREEAEIYRRAGANSLWVGHPLRDVVRVNEDPGAALRRIGLGSARPLVALMPGSRKQEIRDLHGRSSAPPGCFSGATRHCNSRFRWPVRNCAPTSKTLCIGAICTAR